MSILNLLPTIFLGLIAISFVVLVIFLVRLLQEMRKAVIQTTTILSDAGDISHALKQPLLTAGEFYVGLREGFKNFNAIFQRVSKKWVTLIVIVKIEIVAINLSWV